ncbi:MAG: SDR family oxidoreductase [Gammaproteobacteria bacterium]|nr:SDR family oxidoreductase [Gammaproteobacteria bacterium]MYF29366.1 SDR family oxidoreductase [Gammaproteobacteria bacterium]MYK48230.1 SDR family oxidoreductase [Gammaproteobacteria bacterium]
MANRLLGKRVLVTQASDYMGPATVELFEAEGASVIAANGPLENAEACRELVTRAGRVDVLIANLAAPNYSGTAVTELDDTAWHRPFARLVDPLHFLTQAVLPQMIERRQGKIVVYGSATALRGLKTLSAYSAARAAQVGYVQSVGVEVAPHNVQLNLIAQNYVENREYYPPELMHKESFVASLKRQVPAGRLGTAREDAAFALFLASDESGFFAGQAFPFAGGWAQR